MVLGVLIVLVGLVGHTIYRRRKRPHGYMKYSGLVSQAVLNIYPGYLHPSSNGLRLYQV